MFAGTRFAFCVVGLTGLLAACSRPADPASSPPAAALVEAGQADAGIAWRHAATDADVDAVFREARAASRPVFVYWGATWCPPCNQVKATLFNRRDFIERSRAFVPVYVDGDSPGAQKLGARFRVSGYPTMVLFSPQGVELTRLPGEVEAERYTQVLTLGMNAQRPVREVLARARAGGAGLDANDWRLLAFYSWDTDENQLVTRNDLPALLRQLAETCPPGLAESAARLRLEAWGAGPPTQDRADPAARQALLALLADPAAARRDMDVLTNEAPAIVRALSAAGSTERASLQVAMTHALERLEADTTLSRADRMGALIAQVDLARIDQPAADGTGAGARSQTPPPPPLPPTLLADIRTQTARADREITDGYERQSVITAAAYLLERADLSNESDALLESNLARSHSPYYLMSQLASNAKARGDTARALDWYRRAFEASEGPATRLQWGASYLSALVELEPGDETRIEKVAGDLFTEAGRQPDAFYERSGRALKRVGAKLQAWNGGGRHAAVVRRLQARLDGVCGALAAGDSRRGDCNSLLDRKAVPSPT